MSVIVRNTLPEDFDGIQRVCREVYPDVPPYNRAQLLSHIEVFPDGQLTAVDDTSGEAVGLASSLVLLWDDYEIDQAWKDFTAGGTFKNHDPSGHTLYGAEVMVRPSWQGKGVGSKLYAARRALCRQKRLLRIRAGARLRGYHAYASHMTPEEYVWRVARRDLFDPTLTFQLNHGFRVIAVVTGYLGHDPESGGNAAVIEWLNPDVATPEDYRRSAERFPLDVAPWVKAAG